MMMCAWLILFYPSHSSRVLSGNSLVGGNPTMNTPLRLRRGGGIASSSSLDLLLLVMFRKNLNASKPSNY